MVLFDKNTFKNLDTNFRIGTIISDGMWYSLTKWRKLAKATEEEMEAWIEENLESGRLLQSPTGAKSYRFPLSSIYEWYEENDIEMGQQLVDNIFPPRIWDDSTETEGFLDAPLREIGIVSFNANDKIIGDIIEALRGVARVREFEPGRYKAYCLCSSYTKKIIDTELRKTIPKGSPELKMYSRAEAKRREIVDFSTQFSKGLVMFYKSFGKSLVKKEMETIKIFLPEEEDQDSQITIWVLTAIEKFDESTSVPFSGYLNSVLKRWPYDLPSSHLGKDLSSFQRQRSRAIDSLKNKIGEEKNFTNTELAEEMGLDQIKFNEMEEKHRTWTRQRTATTLTWEENADEKMVESNISGDASGENISYSDIKLANRLSEAVIASALNTSMFEDAFKIISQIDVSEIDMSKINQLNPLFIQELGVSMGLIEEEKKNVVI